MRNKKSFYQAVVTDFDWSLIYEQQKINPKTKDIVLKFLKKGFPFIIVTGRPLFTLLPVVKTFGFCDYSSFHMCTYNGAAFTDGRTKETIYDERRIEVSELKQIGEVLDSYHINFLLYYDESIHMNKIFPYKMRKQSIDSLPLVIDPHLLENLQQPAIKAIAASDEERLKEILPVLKQKFPQLDFFFSQKYYIEIVRKGINKGEALSLISQKISVPLSQFVAFGDSDNDLPMLKACGLSFALGNAKEEVKKVATKTIGDVYSSAFGDTLETLFDLSDI